MQDINMQSSPVASAENELASSVVEHQASDQVQTSSYGENTLTSELEIDGARLIEESPPNFKQYEVAVPFGCSEEQIERFEAWDEDNAKKGSRWLNDDL